MLLTILKVIRKIHFICETSRTSLLTLLTSNIGVLIMPLLMTFAIGCGFSYHLLILVVFFRDFVRLNHRLTIAKNHIVMTHKKASELKYVYPSKSPNQVKRKSSL